MIYPGSAYRKLPRPAMTWLIEPIIPAGGSALLYADPKAGKSHLALQIVESIQTGNDWLIYPTRTKGTCVYYQLDTPRSLWIATQEKLLRNHPAIDDAHHGDQETISFPFNILNPEHFKEMQSDLAVKPDLVIIDTIREAHEEDENSATEMKKVISTLTAAVRPSALLIIAHAKKPQMDGYSSLLGDQRGSGYLPGKMDTIMRLSAKNGSGTLRIIGRSIEETTLHLEHTHEHLWKHDSDLPIIQDILDTDHSMPEKARMVAIKLNISEEAARSRLRRAAR